MACLAFSMGLISVYGFFANAVAQDFKVSRTLINSGPIFLLLAPAFIGPVIGKLADKFPIRNLLLIGITVSMSSLLILSQVNSFRSISLCFMFFAAGMVFYGPISVNTFLIKHYQDRSGRALAIAAIGVSLSSSALPPLVAWLMEAYNWRSSLSILSCGLFAVLFSSIFFGIRTRTIKEHSENTVQSHKNLTHQDTPLLRMSAFWFIGLTVAIAFSSALVVVICYPAHFINIGFSTMDTGLLLSATGLAGLAGKFIVAGVVDRLHSHVKLFAIGLLIVQLIGFMGLIICQTFFPIMLCVILAGLGGGAFIPMHPILNANHFNADIIGNVNGAQAPMMLPLGLVGLPLSGYIFDKTGNYQMVFAVVAAMFILAIALLTQLPHRQKK